MICDVWRSRYGVGVGPATVFNQGWDSVESVDVQNLYDNVIINNTIQYSRSGVTDKVSALIREEVGLNTAMYQ